MAKVRAVCSLQMSEPFSSLVIPSIPCLDIFTKVISEDNYGITKGGRQTKKKEELYVYTRNQRCIIQVEGAPTAETV